MVLSVEDQSVYQNSDAEGRMTQWTILACGAAELKSARRLVWAGLGWVGLGWAGLDNRGGLMRCACKPDASWRRRPDDERLELLFHVLVSVSLAGADRLGRLRWSVQPTMDDDGPALSNWKRNSSPVDASPSAAPCC